MSEPIPPAQSCPTVPPAGPGAMDCFHTCMAHLYRGEMHRMTVWRQRLDTTTHWAIILTTMLTSFVLGSTQVPHYISLLGLAFNAIFMLIEGRRYQHLHHSKWRISLLEHNYYARQLSAARPVESSWREQLTADLQQPHVTISRQMGVRLRLRRNYLMLVYVLTGVWLTKLFIHPQSAGSWTEFYQRFAMEGLFPSWFVAATAGLFVLTITVAALLTPSEEALEHWSKLAHSRFVESMETREGQQPGGRA